MWVEAGLGTRSELRKWFAKEGIRYTETKAWLSSVFVFTANPAQKRVLYDWIERNNA